MTALNMNITDVCNSCKPWNREKKCPFRFRSDKLTHPCQSEPWSSSQRNESMGETDGAAKSYQIPEWKVASKTPCSLYWRQQWVCVGVLVEGGWGVPWHFSHAAANIFRRREVLAATWLKCSCPPLPHFSFLFDFHRSHIKERFVPVLYTSIW